MTRVLCYFVGADDSVRPYEASFAAYYNFASTTGSPTCRA